MHQTMRRNTLMSAVVLALASAATLAHAQDAPAAQSEEDSRARELDRVTVTGSLIPQATIETATPVTTITAEDIQRQGFRDVYDVLRAQPLATGAVQDNQFSGGFTASAEPISLLGLDPGFTLVLIDGRPLADYPLLYNGQSNFVDLSSIPTAMVERIDIAPGNQSAIYGSSAIAGVVNIILKKRIDGQVYNFRFGGYQGGGGENSRFQFTGGKQIGDLNLVYGLQYNEQAPIYGYDREDFDSTNDNPDAELRYGSRIRLRSFLDADFNTVYEDPTAANCAQLGGVFGGSVIYDNRPDRGQFCSSREEVGYTTFLNKEESFSGYLNASFALNDRTELYGTLLLNRNKSESNSGSRFWTPSVDTGGYIFNNNTGRFESYQWIFAPEETGDVDFNNQRDTSDSYNVALGVRGALGQSVWDYDVFFNRSEYRIKSRQFWPLKDRIEAFFQEQFLGPQLGEYFGYPIYAPNDAGFYTSLTPEQYRSFNDEIRTDSKTYTQNFNVQLTNTELFELPAGSVGFAAVVQAGTQFWENPTDQRVVNGEFWGLTGTQGSGKRNNEAVALEFRVPILRTLTANLSGRYDQYENEGLNEDSKATYKVGLEFRPIEALLLRANYATAFKAPDMAYVFAGESGFFSSATDYYRCATEDAGTPIDDCEFSGEQYFGNRSGSSDLESITAESWGAGVVWSPSPDFDVSADYYRIKIDNKVTDLSVDNLLQTEAACRLGQLDPSSPTCVDALARVTRAPASAPVPNQLQEVAINPINVSKEEIAGIIAKANWRLETDTAGQFILGAQYNVTLDHENQQFPDDPVIDYLDEPFYSSEFKTIASATVTWIKNNWTTSLYGVRYGRTPNYAAQITEIGYDAPDAGKVDALVRFNSTLTYNFSEDIALSLTVNNLTDEDPPEDDTYTAYPYYNIFNYNDYGRSYFVEINWRFGGAQ